MSFLLFLRDRVIPYLLLLCIFIGGIGGIGWLFAQTYFWNTSDMTFVVDEEIVSARITLQTRIIYKDFVFFQSTYPFHITLPYNRTVSCSKECIFSDIPAGDAEVVLYTQTGLQQKEKIVIAGDTRGSLDLRVPIRIKKIVLENNVLPLSTPGERDIDPLSVLYRNTVQGLWLLYDKGLLFFYDVGAEQKILLGNDFNTRSVVRGIKEGTYYLISDFNTVVLFDRYGREKTEIATYSTLGDQKIVWELRDGSITSIVTLKDQERVFLGRLFWFISDEKHYLFDGENVFEILNN